MGVMITILIVLTIVIALMACANDLRITPSQQREWKAYWDSLSPGEREWQAYLTHHIPGYGREMTRADFGE